MCSAKSLLVTTATSTTLLNIENEVAEIPVPAQIASLPTIAAGSMSNGHLVQVTPTGVRTWSDPVEGLETSSWSAGEDEVVAAQVVHGLAVVARRGGGVAILDTDSKLDVLVYVTSFSDN